jgi:hypothetical protein
VEAVAPLARASVVVAEMVTLLLIHVIAQQIRASILAVATHHQHVLIRLMHRRHHHLEDAPAVVEAARWAPSLGFFAHCWAWAS